MSNIQSTEVKSNIRTGPDRELTDIADDVLKYRAKSRKLRILAVAAAERQGGALSSVPTWQEQGITAVSSNWRSVAGPASCAQNTLQLGQRVRKTGARGRLEKRHRRALL